MKIAFYKSKKHLFNRLVSWRTKGPYSHCEVVLSGDISMARCASSSFKDGGVRIKKMPLPADIWDIVDCPMTQQQEEEVEIWFVRHLGKAYDILGLFGYVFGPGIEARDKWFCSEAVAASLGVAEAWRFDPNNFYSALLWRNASCGR